MYQAERSSSERSSMTRDPFSLFMPLQNFTLPLEANVFAPLPRLPSSPSHQPFQLPVSFISALLLHRTISQLQPHVSSLTTTKTFILEPMTFNQPSIFFLDNVPVKNNIIPLLHHVPQHLVSFDTPSHIDQKQLSQDDAA
jgi:hypothetical protein